MKTQNKSNFLYFRVTPEERKTIENLAVLEQRNLSSIVRLLVSEAINKRKQDIMYVPK
jgi:uncharacterized protein (DUF1778 family)